jgi:DNA-binding FrmR family transcriptional regulator
MAKTSAVCNSCEESGYPDNSSHLNRVNRIIGQLEGVKRMIEDRRYCPEIMTQTRAISSAVRSLEAKILQGHLENCVRDAFSSNAKDSEKKIEELVELFRKSR